MSKLKYLVIHCTATPEGREVSSDDIRRWHTGSKANGGRGWKQVGYSDMIHINGSLENLVPFNQDDNVDRWEVTNGARGINGRSRHVVYVGGMNKEYTRAKDTRTVAQMRALETYVKYMILRHPDIKVIGHNEVASKACPSFDVPIWLERLGIDSKHIGV